MCVARFDSFQMVYILDVIGLFHVTSIEKWM